MIPWLAQSAIDHPNTLAIVADNTSLTYAQLARDVQRRAAALQALGINKHARVGLHTAPDSENSLEWITTAHAIFWLGATLIPLHSRASLTELNFQLAKIPLDLLILGPESSLIGHNSSKNAPQTIPTTELLAPPNTTCEPAQISPEDILTILFTSGTTGQPKAVPLTVANHHASALASRKRLKTPPITPDSPDRWLCTLPLCHVGGLAILIRSAIYGTTVELTTGFDPDHILHLLQARPITLASFVPTMLYRLLDAAQTRPMTSNLRAILIGGGAIDPELLRTARRHGLPVVPTYGMTEASTQITTLAPSTHVDPATDHLDTAGKPLDGIEIRIQNSDGSACKPNEIGTISVRGPMLTTGYIAFQDDRFQNGWYKTGDMGRLNEDGYLTIEHRHGDLIVTGGENVDPNEVERILRQLDAIKDVAIVGIDNPEWGQSVAAAIVCNPLPQNPKDFLETTINHCRSQLARFKIPRNWLIVPEIPRTASGKVLKEPTRQLFSNPQATTIYAMSTILKSAPAPLINQPASNPKFPRVGQTSHNKNSTVAIGDVVFGAKEFVVIAGPCAVESQEVLDQAAQAVQQLGARVLRGGAFKPRTSPDAFQGLGLDGVAILRRTADQFKIPFVTEVLSPEMVERMEPDVDAFQIGARNMQNYPLLEAVGRTNRPVLLKRHFGSTLTEWLLAAEYIAKAGNNNIILCERGIRTFATETRFTLDLAGAIWAKQQTHLPVITDPSHAIGLPDLLAAATAATAAAGLDGVILEVHPHPNTARCDADQALTIPEFQTLMTRLHPITHAIGRTLQSPTQPTPAPISERVP